MALGRLIERLFVQVRADLSQMSSELQSGVKQTQTATQQMARQWNTVSSSIEALEADLRRGLITQGQYMSQMNRHASQVAALGGTYREAQRQVFGYAASLRQAAAVQQVAMNPVPMQRFARSAGMARSQMLNLGFQLNDIGQTLATGMNPMTVMIQQGSQIAQIYGGQGGINALFGDLGRIFRGLVLRLWPVAAVIGAVTAGFSILTREVNKTTDVGITMGDTFRAVFQVIGRRILALIDGPLTWLGEKWDQLANFLAETFPPVMNAIIGSMVAGVRIIGATWDLLPDLWHDTWTMIKNFTVTAIEAIINFVTQEMVPGIAMALQHVVNTFNFTFEAVKIIWMQLPAIMQDAIAGAVNAVVAGLENMINASIRGVNKLIEALNELIQMVGADQALELFGFSGAIQPLSEQDLREWRMETGNALNNTTQQIAEAAGRIFRENWLEQAGQLDETDLSEHLGAFRNAFSELGRRIDDILTEEVGTDFMGQFFDEVRIQAIENAMRRIAEGTEDIGDAARKAADEVQDLMERLDEQLTTAADNLARVFGNAFERLAETGRFTFREFVKDMNKLIIRSTSELLQQELSNMFKRLATSQGGLGSIFSNLFTGLFGGGIPGRQGGGISMPFQNFVAGEQGPELITADGPSGARRVSTAGQTRQMMQQDNRPNQVIINVSTPDVESFRRSQSQLAARASMFLARGRRNQ